LNPPYYDRDIDLEAQRLDDTPSIQSSNSSVDEDSDNSNSDSSEEEHLEGVLSPFKRFYIQKISELLNQMFPFNEGQTRQHSFNVGLLGSQMTDQIDGKVILSALFILAVFWYVFLLQDLFKNSL
jgi:hypothetical protein